MNIMKSIKLTIIEFIGLENNYEFLLLKQENIKTVLSKVFILNIN